MIAMDSLTAYYVAEGNAVAAFIALITVIIVLSYFTIVFLHYSASYPHPLHLIIPLSVMIQMVTYRAG